MFEFITKLFRGSRANKSGTSAVTHELSEINSNPRDPVVDYLHMTTAGGEEFDDMAVARMIDEGCPNAD